MDNKDTEKRFCSLLSLCKKAGKLSIGEAKTTEDIRRGSAKLIILADDASDNTKKKFSDMAAYRNIKLITAFDRFNMGACIGKEFLVSCCVTDDGFAGGLLKIFDRMG